MVISLANPDSPKKKKKKKNGGRSKERNEASADTVSLVAEPSKVPLKNLFLERSKTLTDFRRKSKNSELGISDQISGKGQPEEEKCWTFERSQPSLRKKINTFIQNSPLLKRASFLKGLPHLRDDLNRLTDSIESLKIDEDSVMTAEPVRRTMDPEKKMLRKLHSRSCNEFNFVEAAESASKCSACIGSTRAREPENARSGSLWNLPLFSDKSQNGKATMERSISLHLSVRPWTWISGNGRHGSQNHQVTATKNVEGEFCNKCGLPLNWEENKLQGATTNTPSNKDLNKKPRKSKPVSPEPERPCKLSNEAKSKPQDWTRKLVGSIRRKISTEKSHSTASNSDSGSHHEEVTKQKVDDQVRASTDQQEGKVETLKKVFTDVEEFELSPKAETRRRKMSLSGSHLERKYSHRNLLQQRTITDNAEAERSQEGVTFERCKIRRKLSFPSPGDAILKTEIKAPKKKDFTLLAFIFKKQSSVEIKREVKEPAVEKPRKIPDFSFSNPISPGVESDLKENFQRDFKCSSHTGLNIDEPKTNFSSRLVDSNAKTVSRSCGQVEMISSDPAVRENFLQATMSIFLAVSPPSSKLQVRSRSLTHIDQIEQKGQKSGIFFKEISSERASEQLTVPTNISKYRRQMLSRSEANSSECFTVGIEGLGDDINDEFVQASKTTILRNALVEICKRRGIDLASSNVFLDANKSPLPCLDIDTSWMGGKHIRIKVNDRVTSVKKDQKNSFAPPIKKISSSYKGTKSGNRTHNASSEEPSVVEPGPSGKSAKRWSGFFGTSRDTSKMETLIDLLDSYTKNGIYEYKEDIYKLESDWKVIVANAGTLEDRHSQQQEAIWELLRSEIDYIKMLKVVSHLFIACLLNLQSNQLLLEIDNKRLFGNVEEIYSCNDLFWKKHLVPVVESSRKTGEPLNPELLKDGFMDFPNIFKCYETYCTQQARCQHYCREKLQQDQDNELFTAYLVWCETQKECNRLKLLDILVKPMQRLTKYSLLLKAILKHTVNPGHRDSLINMIRSVDFFVNNVNSTLKQNQDLETMKQLMTKIESYDVIESKDDDLSNLIQKYSTLNLTHDIPGTAHKRSLLFESDVKYKDALTSSKIEVHAFLFTDFLLITKPVKRLGESKVKFKIIRQPYVMDQLITQEITREPPSLACVYLSIYKTACTAFMLSCGETDLLKSWSDAIKKAKNLYSSLKGSQGVGSQPVQTPTMLPISRQPSGYTNEDVSVGENLEESKTINYNLGLWAGRSPRGSSYGSRVSSLVHSHSGSMEMTENISSISSVSASRGVSVENNSEVRGSSLSSDDGNPNLMPSPRVELTTTPRIEKRDTSPVPERRESPILHRPESKSMYRKSATKSENTLTIQVPHLGQSLPNLNIASSSSGSTGQNPCLPNTLLLAPPKSHGGFLSPSQRGVSYPPPSPPRGSLKRGFAISPRNPPLMKTAHVSVELSRSTSVTQPSETEKPVEEKKSKTIGLQTNFNDFALKPETKPSETKCSQCLCSNRATFLKSGGKKLLRSDKRYHTAGTIDDLKVKKDSSIHKRLSFNSGNERPTTVDPIEPSPINKHLSIASIQSSSGFSSAGSSVEGLFSKEEGNNESKPSKFEETLRVINVEHADNESGQEQRPRTDLERFDEKVSQWHEFVESKKDNSNENYGSFNVEPFSRNSPNGSSISQPSGFHLAGKYPKSAKDKSNPKFSDRINCFQSVTVFINALQLENIIRISPNKLSTTERSKKKRRNTL